MVVELTSGCVYTVTIFNMHLMVIVVGKVSWCSSKFSSVQSAENPSLTPKNYAYTGETNIEAYTFYLQLRDGAGTLL